MQWSACALTSILLCTTAGAAPPRSRIKIALIIESTVDDKGWGQAMYEAVKNVQIKYGTKLVEYNYSEKMKPVDAGSAARQYASRGFDIVICHGVQYKNLVLEMAQEFPKTSFAFGTSADIGPRNVFTYLPQSEETGYLHGLIAGLVTKTNLVGIVGTVDGGDPARYNRGFLLGAKAVNTKVNIKVAHTGSFSDFVKASELAHTHIKANADVLMGPSQQAMGALRAVATYKDKPVWWLGQDLAQIASPEGFKVIAAASYNYTPIVEEMIQRREAGVLGGENIPLNMANGGFTYRFNDRVGPVLTPAIRKAVDKARADLRSGKLKIDWKNVKL